MCGGMLELGMLIPRAGRTRLDAAAPGVVVEPIVWTGIVRGVAALTLAPAVGLVLPEEDGRLGAELTPDAA